MGSVYQVQDRERGGVMALKTLDRPDAINLVRFKREFRTLADLHHVNLATLYELVAEQDTWYFTMEYVDGVPFQQWVRPPATQPAVKDLASHSVATTGPTRASLPTLADEPISGNEPASGGGPPPRRRPPGAQEDTQSLDSWALEPTMERAPEGVVPESLGHSENRVVLSRLHPSLRQLAEGVHALHQAGTVHRDLKPSNVLVTPESRVVILDFGLSKRRGSPTVTGHGLSGTPAYMAPEQAVGGVIDARTDLYGLGCVLYHLATGQFPFVAETAMAVLYRHVHDPVVPPARVDGCDVPGWLSDVIVRLMAKSQDERPASAAEVIQLLEAPPAVARASAATADLRPGGVLPGAPGPGEHGERSVVGAAGDPTALALHAPEAGLGDPPGPVESFELDGDPSELGRPTAGLPGASSGAPFGWSTSGGVGLQGGPQGRPPRPPSPLVTRPAPHLHGGQRLGRAVGGRPTGRRGAGLGLGLGLGLQLARGGLVAALVAAALAAVALWWFGRGPTGANLESDAAAPLGDTLYEQRCEAGNLAACLDAAVRFRDGVGVAEDRARSNRLFARVVVGYRAGCDEGSGAFCHELAEFYRAGTYVPVDVGRAEELERQACALGYTSSCSP